MKNAHLETIIKTAREQSAPIWKRVGRELSGARRRYPAVNLAKIEKYGKKELVVVVPGKVLGTGQITKQTVVAVSFSKIALAKIKKSGGTAELLESYILKNKEGKKVQLLK